MPSTVTPSPAIHLIAPEEIRGKPFKHLDLRRSCGRNRGPDRERAHRKESWSPWPTTREGSTWEVISGHPPAGPRARAQG